MLPFSIHSPPTKIKKNIYFPFFPEFSDILMANFLLFFIPISSFFIHSTMGNPRTELVSKKCGRQHAQNVSQFNENYSKVIASMQESMRENKFSIGEEGKPPNRVYVLAQCMEDLSKDDCEICFDSIKTQIPGCFPHHSARVYYDGCFLRVENYSFFQESSSQDYDITRCSDAQNVQDNNFDPLVKQLITELKTEAPENRGYAERQVTLYVLTVYGMANCWRTLDKKLCANCLANASNEISRCLPSLEARALHAGCYLRYSDSEFFNKPESSANRDAILLYLSIVFGTVGVCLLAIVVGYFVGASIHQRRINCQIKQKRLEFDSDITKRSLHFKYSTLEKATNNFNEAVKIGQGGSGEVFKGTLPDGREIAIKRLFLTGKLQNQEVCNEIDIIGQAQHPNLVRFLGCCFTNDDSFLVYEFLANRSLDLILFDEEKKKELTWKKRLVIIIGTAEGLEYLHKDCQVRIIHRDIKASNILLDMKHRAKIADFGIARLNSNNEGVGSSAIAGTFGYMAPEYLAQGRLTDKVDVYSYGVLLLEIISGVQNNKFQSDDSLDTLVTISWKHFKRNTVTQIIDSSIGNENTDEVQRVVQIALLCTQESPDMRPTMTQVLELLTQKDVVLPVPSKPPFTEESLIDSYLLGAYHTHDRSASVDSSIYYDT